MSRRASTYSDDTGFEFLIVLAIAAVIAAIFLFNPFGWESAEPAKPDWREASCWNIPAQYGGGTYCSDEEAGGDHGYVNPGSMEWEVE